MYKSFIIHLSKIESSLQSSLELQQSLKLHNIDAELFEGSYGDSTKKDYIKSNRKYHHIGIKGFISEDERNKFWGIPGEIGCFDSHYRLWQRCVDLNEPILIFEDDVTISRKFYNVNWEDVLSVAFSHTKKMIKYQHFLDSPTGEPKAEDYYQSSMPGNGGYAIKPHAAKILVDEYKNSYLPADNAINQQLVKIQIHNHMMGRARSKHEGNVSLIKTKIWDTRLI